MVEGIGTEFPPAVRAKSLAAWLLRLDGVIGATPTPLPGPHITWEGELQTISGVLMEIKGGSLTLEKSRSSDIIDPVSEHFTEALPAYSVDVTAEAPMGNVTIYIEEQPRPWNDYTAKLALVQETYSAQPIYQYIVISWGSEVQPEPTVTPWPTWDANQPSPTPVQGAPKVLWIGRSGVFNTDDRTGFGDFQSVFADMGAENTNQTAGSEAITDELLSVYNAAVFCDTRDQPPLSEDEREAVVRFVRGGGSIFVIGQQDDRYVLDPAAIYAGSITEPFGIQFSTTVSGTYVDFEPHPLLYRVFEMSGSGGSELIVEPPAMALGMASDGKVILAAAEDGYGRVVAYSDETAFFNEEDSSFGWGLSENSHRQFAGNLAAWMLRLEETHIPTATPTRTVGPTATATPTQTIDPNAPPTATPVTINLLERYPNRSDRRG